MASKATLADGEERPAPAKPSPVKRQVSNSEPNMFARMVGVWSEFSRFLSDVRAEMRKVVAPSRKEVEVTTTVVVITVFLFGVFFFAVDWIFNLTMHGLLQKLVGMQ